MRMSSAKFLYVKPTNYLKKSMLQPKHKLHFDARYVPHVSAEWIFHFQHYAASSQGIVSTNLVDFWNTHDQKNHVHR